MKYFDKINNFIEGKINTDDSEKFESELTTNEELKKEYDAYRAAEVAAHIIGYDLLTKKRQKSRPIRIWMSIAAGILFLIVGSFWYANTQYSISGIVHHDYIQPNLSTIRGDINKNTLAKIKEAFYSNDLAQIEKLISGLQPEDPIYIPAQFILGHNYMNNGDFDLAATAFQLVINNKESRYIPNARWNKILALLSIDRHKEATYDLQYLLDNPSDDYHQKSLELERKLQSNWQKIVF